MQSFYIVLIFKNNLQVITAVINVITSTITLLFPFNPPLDFTYKCFTIQTERKVH